MTYPIYWSVLAKEDYSNILIFLQENFSEEVALNFLEKTEKVIDQIAKYPFSFPSSIKKQNCRKATINKYTALIYRISNNEVETLLFKDNRMKDIF